MFCVVKRKAKSTHCRALTDGTILFDNIENGVIKVTANKAFTWAGMNYEANILVGMVYKVKQEQIARGLTQAKKYLKIFDFV